MIARLLAHLRGQWMGALALFLVLTGGVAYATHEVILSSDIVDGEVKAPDIAQGAVATSEIAKDQVHSIDVRDDTLAGGGLAAADLQASSVGSSELSNGSVGNADLALNSVNTPRVVNDSLFGIDIREDSLNPLDAHDAFAATCDPHGPTPVVCASLEFFLERPMPVLALFNWSFYSDDDVGEPVMGTCNTRVDGSNTSSIGVGSNDATVIFRPTAATPVLDVLTLPAGTHRVQLACGQDQADIVFAGIRLGVVELGPE
jgi:hypothetical protein